MPLDLMRCLEAMEKKQASDLHLKSGAPPIARKNGALMLLFNEHPPLNSKDLKASIEEILKPYHKQILAEEKQLDFSYGVPGLGRFRFNIFYQRGTLRVVVRNIPFKVPDFNSLNLPPQAKRIVETNTRGLILVTGATGNGKSSTVAAIAEPYQSKPKPAHHHH